MAFVITDSQCRIAGLLEMDIRRICISTLGFRVGEGLQRQGM